MHLHELVFCMIVQEGLKDLQDGPERGWIAQVEKVEGEDAEVAARRHAELHFGGVGVDAPQPTDQYYKLLVERCFYVGGMGSKCQAEVITAAEYMVRMHLLTPHIFSPTSYRMLIGILGGQSGHLRWQ